MAENMKKIKTIKKAIKTIRRIETIITIKTTYYIMIIWNICKHLAGLTLPRGAQWPTHPSSLDLSSHLGCVQAV